MTNRRMPGVFRALAGSSRHALVCAAAWACCLGALTLAGCAGGGAQQADGARAPGVIANEAAFLPLDLPPPSDTRLITGEPGPAYWQQRCDHDIQATLDPAANTIRAAQRMTYTNNSPTDLGFVWIQLEQNRFRPDSIGSMMQRPPSEDDDDPARFQGGFDELEVAVVDEHGREQPVPIDVVGTVGRIDLPAPVRARGGQVVIAMRWAFHIPDSRGNRMGVGRDPAGDIYQIAQWFPTACVYDDAAGWNTLQYIGGGEFYTNFGSYDVALTVPDDHLVVATGTLTNERDVLSEGELARLSQARAASEPVVIVGKDDAGTHRSPISSNGTSTWRFHADDVRTFAWASSAAFLWDACAIPADTLARPADQGPVLVQSVYPADADLWAPDAKDGVAADSSGRREPGPGGSTRFLRDSIIYYSTTWYPYPYPCATNLCGTNEGSVGGMEYPMILFCGGRSNVYSLWFVTTHEIGHNWFPMLVNTNERVHAWMDEGFNTFINSYATEDRYGNPAYHDDEWMAKRMQRAHEAITPGRLIQCVDTPADLLESGTLGLSQYARTSVAMRFLRERVLGPQRFDHAFHEYIRRWAFKSPTPADFFRTMENVSGVDLDWFFRAWFYSTATPDIAIAAVRQPEKNTSIARVTLRNVGGMPMPVHYRITYADNTTEDRVVPAYVWATKAETIDWWDTHGRRVRRVELDPDGKTPDADPQNNAWGR